MAITTKFAAESGLWIIEAESTNDDKILATELQHALQHVNSAGGDTAQLWIHAVDESSDRVATSLGAVAYRDLWQLRCPLPAAASGLETRAFTAQDTDELIAVNNRAFAWHPEQSGMTRGSIEATMAEPWFDPDGFRLLEREGELIGFCWTKLHHDMNPVHGEIYVIAIDPSAHGQGLGAPMTLAGLEWISAQGIEHALLYVESDNDPANATYRRIGFERHQTNRAYNVPTNVAAS